MQSPAPDPRRSCVAGAPPRYRRCLRTVSPLRGLRAALPPRPGRRAPAAAPAPRPAPPVGAANGPYGVAFSTRVLDIGGEEWRRGAVDVAQENAVPQRR